MINSYFSGQSCQGIDKFIGTYFSWKSQELDESIQVFWQTLKLNKSYLGKKIGKNCTAPYLIICNYLSHRWCNGAWVCACVRAFQNDIFIQVENQHTQSYCVGGWVNKIPLSLFFLENEKFRGKGEKMSLNNEFFIFSTSRKKRDEKEVKKNFEQVFGFDFSLKIINWIEGSPIWHIQLLLIIIYVYLQFSGQKQKLNFENFMCVLWIIH